MCRPLKLSYRYRNAPPTTQESTPDIVSQRTPTAFGDSPERQLLACVAAAVGTCILVSAVVVVLASTNAVRITASIAGTTTLWATLYSTMLAGAVLYVTAPLVAVRYLVDDVLLGLLLTAVASCSYWYLLTLAAADLFYCILPVILLVPDRCDPARVAHCSALGYVDARSLSSALWGAQPGALVVVLFILRHGVRLVCLAALLLSTLRRHPRGPLRALYAGVAVLVVVEEVLRIALRESGIGSMPFYEVLGQGVKAGLIPCAYALLELLTSRAVAQAADAFALNGALMRVAEARVLTRLDAARW